MEVVPKQLSLWDAFKLEVCLLRECGEFLIKCQDCARAQEDGAFTPPVCPVFEMVKYIHMKRLQGEKNV